MAPTLSIPTRGASLILLGTMLLSIAQVAVATPAGSLVEAPARVRRVFVDDMAARGSKVRRGKGWEEQNWSSWASSATDAKVTSVVVADETHVARVTGTFASDDVPSSSDISSGVASFTTDDSSTWATTMPAPCPPPSTETDTGIVNITGSWTMIPGASIATACDASYWSSATVETAVSGAFSGTDASFTGTGINSTKIFPTATDASFTDASATQTAFAFSDMPSISVDIGIFSVPFESAAVSSDASFFGTATSTGDVSATADIWATETGGAFTVIYKTVTVTECPFFLTATDDTSFATTATDVFSGTATDDTFPTDAATDDVSFATSATDVFSTDATKTGFVQIRPDPTEAPASSITAKFNMTTFKTVTASRSSKHS